MNREEKVGLDAFWTHSREENHNFCTNGKEALRHSEKQV